MSDLETLEQADKALQAVVEAFSRLQEPADGVPGVVTDYVLIYAAHRFEDDGETSTAIGYAYPPSGQPHYRTMGLLDYMRTMLRRQIGDDDG